MVAVNQVPDWVMSAITAKASRSPRGNRGVLGPLLLVSACSVSVDRAQEGVSAPLVPFGICSHWMTPCVWTRAS